MNPTPSDEARAAFDDITEDLTGAGARTGSMFGMPCLKAGSKAFAGLYGDAAVFKLPAGDLERALGPAGRRALRPVRRAADARVGAGPAGQLGRVAGAGRGRPGLRGGLRNGGTYRPRVRAVNAIGAGPASAAVTIKPHH